MPDAGPGSVPFERLALPLVDEIYHAALSLSKDEHDARDLAQEAFLHALRHYGQFRPGTNFRAWIFTILKNAHLDSCRRRGVRPVTAEFEEDALPATDPIPLPLPDHFSDRMTAALHSLPPRHRVLLFLCDVEGFSYREIAEILGCPIGTVMSSLFHARRRLRERLSAP